MEYMFILMKEWQEREKARQAGQLQSLDDIFGYDGNNNPGNPFSG